MDRVRADSSEIWGIGTEMGVDPAVKAVAQTEMERGEGGVALLVLVCVPPGGGRCQADEEGVVSRRVSKVPEEVGGEGGVGSRRISMVSRFSRSPVPLDREGLMRRPVTVLRGSGTSRPSAVGATRQEGLTPARSAATQRAPQSNRRGPLLPPQ